VLRKKRKQTTTQNEKRYDENVSMTGQKREKEKSQSSVHTTESKGVAVSMNPLVSAKKDDHPMATTTTLPNQYLPTESVHDKSLEDYESFF